MMGSASCFHIKPVEPLQDVGTAHGGYAISASAPLFKIYSYKKNANLSAFVSISRPCRLFAVIADGNKSDDKLEGGAKFEQRNKVNSFAQPRLSSTFLTLNKKWMVCDYGNHAVSWNIYSQGSNKVSAFKKEESFSSQVSRLL